MSRTNTVTAVSVLALASPSVGYVSAPMPGQPGDGVSLRNAHGQERHQTSFSGSQGTTPIVACGFGAAAISGMASLASQHSKRSKTTSSKRKHVILKAFESELGVQAPVGFWDPLGFTTDGNELSFKRRRAVELKHGRLSMLATMGYLTPEITGKFPGFLSKSMNLKFADIPNGLEALTKVPALGWAQIVGYAFLCEIRSLQEDYKTCTPGDYGWKVLTSEDPAEKTKKLNAELANGRLAMVAIMGMMFQNGTVGSTSSMWLPSGAFEGELGVQAPVGYWDPLGLAKDGDAEAFRRRRETEIKHGRVAMFATLGYIVPEYVRWPGYCAPSDKLSFTDIPNGLGALNTIAAPGWLQIFLFAGLIEVGFYREDPSRAPGDFENGGILGVPNATSYPDGEVKTTKLNAELANGRLAMMAIIGMFFQDGLTGQAWGDWALYTASPLRAFESELGVQAPVGFFDPMGLTKDGDAEAFKRRRNTEIKHGRVAMWAAMGYIVPEFTRWPGYCSPSLNLRFEDIPSGLAALSKVPGAGWCQIFAFIGLLEKGLLVYDPARAPGDFKNGGVLGVPNGSFMPDGPAKTRKLNSEIANGRLAMMAIIGMFFQDGLTGSAWGDWANYVDSPLRARGGASFNPAEQVGATEPLGYWDPCGFSKDEKTFLDYRGIELKHGRVAMMCIVGFLGQHFWRFPGFESVPDGVGALETAPGSYGFAVFFLVVGFIELRFAADLERGNPPGNFGDPFKILKAGNGGYDERWRNMELNNGRLAMIGAIGTIVANASTGLDAFEQWQQARPAAIDYVKTTLWWAA